MCVLQASRAGVPPTVKLDGQYKFVDAMQTLIPAGAPSLIKCDKLTVEGKVKMEARRRVCCGPPAAPTASTHRWPHVAQAGVRIEGTVKVVGPGTLKKGTYKDQEVKL